MVDGVRRGRTGDAIVQPRALATAREKRATYGSTASRGGALGDVSSRPALPATIRQRETESPNRARILTGVRDLSRMQHEKQWRKSASMARGRRRGQRPARMPSSP